MRTPITVQTLDSLKPRPARYEIRDTKLPGFLVRVQPSGVVSFIAQLGRGKRVTLGKYPSCTLARARKLALAALHHAEDGASTAEVREKIRPTEEATPTLREFLDDTYRPWLEKNRKAGASEGARLEGAFPTFLDISMRDITGWSVERWRADRLKAGIRPTSCNREIASLAACLRRAVAWEALETFPLTGVKL